MKLLTHNFLSSRFLKDVTTGYPLKLKINEKVVRDVEYEADFLKNLLVKLDYGVVYDVAKSIGEHEDLPDPANPFDLDKLEERQVKQLHKVLMCIDVVDGSLECPETGRIFPIKDGIPNMLVSETDLV